MRKLLAAALAVCLALALMGCTPKEPENPQLGLERTVYSYEAADLSVEIENLSKAAGIVLKADGRAVAESAYAISGDRLTLRRDWLETLEEGSRSLTLECDLGSVTFRVTIPQEPPVIEAPSLDEDAFELELSDLKDGLSVPVNYHGGAMVGLYLNGEKVDDACLSIGPSALTLSADYLLALGEGDYEFTLTTDGGSCTFTVGLIYGRLSAAEDTCKLFTGSDLSLRVNGAADRELSLALNGAPVSETMFSYESGAVIVKSEVFSALKKEVYTLSLSDGQDCVVFTVFKGMTRDSVMLIDFDAFEAPGLGYGQNLEISVEPNGIDGASGVINNRSQGTFLKLDSENIAYRFEAGKAYAFSMDFVVRSVKAGTSSVLDLVMPMWFSTPDGNADIMYLRYDAQAGWYVTLDRAGSAATLTRSGDIWHLYVEFLYQENYGSLQIADWMQCELLVDNVLLRPADGLLTVPDSLDFSLAFGSEADVSLAFGDVNVLGISLGSVWADSAKVAVDGGRITFRGSYLKDLPRQTQLSYTVYTDKGRVSGTISVEEYDISLTGDSFRYAADGQDMTFTLDSAGLTLQSLSLNGRELTAEEYALSGGTLTLRSVLLDRILSSAELTLLFSQNQQRTYTLTSKRQIAIDFDRYAAPATGFAVGATLTEVADGIDGASGRIVTTQSATLFSAGEHFNAAQFEAGKIYTLTMQFRIDQIDASGNFVIPGSPVFMPIYFAGGGSDVVYVNYEDGEVKLSVQSKGANASLTKDENGVYTMTVEMLPGEGNTQLTCDLWMPLTMTVDNISIVEK